VQSVATSQPEKILSDAAAQSPVDSLFYADFDPRLTALGELAELKMREGEYSDAEPLCDRALKIQETDYRLDNSQLRPAQDLYVVVQRHLHGIDKANALAARAAALRQKTMPGAEARPR
jgi:hypothetical protein